MEKTADFTEGRILSRLLRFALPVLAALFLQAMYGAVDLMVVGQFGAPTDVSAVSTGSQIMQTVTSLITGLAMGITILVGQKIGEKRPEQAGDVIGSGICLFGVLAAVLTVLMILGAGFLAGLMHAPDEAFSQTVDYIRICSAGAVFIIAYNVLGSIFRGIGDSRMPLFTVAAACVFNIGGDLLLVAGFHMGAAGAALATVAAQAAGVGVAEKLCAFIMLVASAYMQSMSAFVAQNMGAGKPERAKRALLYGIGTSLMAGVTLFYFSFFHGDAMAGIFARDPQVVAAAADYLKAYAIDCILTSFLFCFVGYFNGCGKTFFVMVQGIVGAFCVRIPVSWFMSRMAGVTLFKIGLATPCSSAVQILLCAAYFIWLSGRSRKHRTSA